MKNNKGSILVTLAIITVIVVAGSWFIINKKQDQNLYNKGNISGIQNNIDDSITKEPSGGEDLNSVQTNNSTIPDQTSPQPKTPITVYSGGGPLLDIICAGSNCVAVGNTPSGLSEIVFSSNKGQNWSMVFSENIVDTDGGPGLSSVTCVANLCIAVGGGTMAKSIDYGESWTGQASDVSVVSCVNTSLCYGQTSTKDIVRTTSSGANWEVINNTDRFNKMICKNELECFAVGGARTVFKTTDGWETFSFQKLVNDSGTFSGLTLSGNTIMVAEGYHQRFVFRSIDGGNSWTSLDIPQSTKNSGGNIFCTNQDCVLVFQNLPNARIDILKSSDSGETWETSQYNKKASLFGISCNDIGCYASGGIVPTGIIVKVD